MPFALESRFVSLRAWQERGPGAGAPPSLQSASRQKGAAHRCARGLRLRAVLGGASMEQELRDGAQGDAAPPPPILSGQEVLERLRARPPHRNTGTYRAMYSSVAGGITRDPAAMVLPLDDHMVHRGHAVFDTAIISNGFLYELDEHLDRLLRSAAAAKIPFQWARRDLRDVILATAAASGLEKGYLKYWLSAGPGGFWISPSECPSASFYVMAIAENLSKDKPQSMRMVTSSVPMKSPSMSTTKTVNYLPNVLVHLEAEEAGMDEALWIDERGFVGEGPTMNVAFVSQDDVLLVPSFERILAGCTVKRVMQLARALLPKEGDVAANGTPPQSTSGTPSPWAPAVPLLRAIRHAPVPEAEARQAKEMMLVGSGTQVTPVVEWDAQPVGDGKPGPVAAALQALLQEAYQSGPLVPIPKLYDQV